MSREHALYGVQIFCEMMQDSDCFTDEDVEDFNQNIQREMEPLDGGFEDTLLQMKNKLHKRLQIIKEACDKYELITYFPKSITKIANQNAQMLKTIHEQLKQVQEYKQKMEIYGEL